MLQLHQQGQETARVWKVTALHACPLSDAPLPNTLPLASISNDA
jgi:hypothetical protein